MPKPPRPRSARRLTRDSARDASARSGRKPEDATDEELDVGVRYSCGQCGRGSGPSASAPMKAAVEVEGGGGGDRRPSSRSKESVNACALRALVAGAGPLAGLALADRASSGRRRVCLAAPAAQDGQLTDPQTWLISHRSRASGCW